MIEAAWFLMQSLGYIVLGIVIVAIFQRLFKDIFRR